MKKSEPILANNQGGFTLIEIIAVLVILGLLSAFAVPKYMNTQNQARIKSARAAIAETKYRLSSTYAQYLLANNGSAPDNINALCNFINDTSILPKNGNGNVLMGNEYAVNLKNNGTITVTAVQGVAVSGVTGTWTMP